MTIKRDERPWDSSAGVDGICANPGCERPAAEELCEACALEWSLFHRESRVDLWDAKGFTNAESGLKT